MSTKRKKKTPEEAVEIDKIKSVMDELTSFMGSMSFAPRKPYDKRTVEFSRNYIGKGEVSRVVVVIKKDKVGLEPEHPEYFTITTQTHVRATEEGIDKGAPSFCKDDLLRILSKFDSPDMRTELVKNECAACGTTSTDFVETKKGLVCHDCKRRLG